MKLILTKGDEQTDEHDCITRDQQGSLARNGSFLLLGSRDKTFSRYFELGFQPSAAVQVFE
jgi:hypothetical protein